MRNLVVMRGEIWWRRGFRPADIAAHRTQIRTVMVSVDEDQAASRRCTLRATRRAWASTVKVGCRSPADGNTLASATQILSIARRRPQGSHGALVPAPMAQVPAS